MLLSRSKREDLAYSHELQTAATLPKPDRDRQQSALLAWCGLTSAHKVLVCAPPAPQTKCPSKPQQPTGDPLMEASVGIGGVVVGYYDKWQEWAGLDVWQTFKLLENRNGWQGWKVMKCTATPQEEPTNN